MAFTGDAVVKRVAEGLFRITGLSLATGASGTIGLNLNPNGPAGPGEVDLLAPEWEPYGDVTLQDAVSVLINAVAGNGPAASVSVVKSGTTHANFLATIHNTSGSEGPATPELEIFVRFH